MLARALARQSNAAMLALRPSDLFDKWVGESEKKASAAFSLARKLGRCVIFIDEVDAILGSRDDPSAASTKDTVNQVCRKRVGSLNLAREADCAAPPVHDGVGRSRGHLSRHHCFGSHKQASCPRRCGLEANAASRATRPSVSCSARATLPLDACSRARGRPCGFFPVGKAHTFLLWLRCAAVDSDAQLIALILPRCSSDIKNVCVEAVLNASLASVERGSTAPRAATTMDHLLRAIQDNPASTSEDSETWQSLRAWDRQFASGLC